MINEVKTLDQSIAEQANGVIIYLNNVSAVRELKQILSQDRQGANKVYLIPDIKDWYVKIELAGSYAFADSTILSKLRAVSGVTQIKEI